jgi:hypothetical protein
MTAVCPVCKRAIPITSKHHIMWAHNDKCDQRCPMSGKPVRDDEIFGVAS